MNTEQVPDTTANEPCNPNIISEPKEANETSVEISNNHDGETVKYCTVHGCQISEDETIITNDN